MPPESPRPAASVYAAWASIEAANDALEITPQTGLCRWDGQPVQYEFVVNGLCDLDLAAARAAVDRDSTCAT